MTENFRTTETAAAKRARPGRRRAAPIEISRVDPRVLEMAKQLAAGDTARFKLVPGEIGIAVIVLNQSSS